MVLKAERERVKALLTEAITVLCKNGLGYKYTCAIEGLLGITLDDEDVFLVNINETIQKAERPAPVEELAKQETGTASPASSSPSGTPRRRRRHSQEGEAQHSPAKRANYGTGEQEQQQSAAKEDVIVIKEEVSETEFTDFYGDTGGGNNDDGGQYAMQQGDQQYPGAGCSQWDTSQTQGGQSDWPAFNPTQQQQAAISQAASSAMMSPSQETGGRGESTQAAYKMTSLQVRKVINEQIVAPVLANQWVVTAFRMYWKKEQPYSSDLIWRRIAEIRAMLDGLVRQVPGLIFIVSAINASNTTLSDGHRMVKPGVAYWVVSRGPLGVAELSEYMGNNKVEASLKLLLQPFQSSERDITNCLCAAVKDNMGGCVRRIVEESQATLGTTDKEAICKIYSSKDGPMGQLSNAISHLQQVRFYAELYEI